VKAIDLANVMQLKFVDLLSAGLVTCLHLSNISVDWTSVAALENQSSDCGPTASCFRSSVVYVCTSYSQLVQCHDGRLSSVVDLPFNDGILLKELDSATRSTLFVVQSQRNMVAVVDVSKHQVCNALTPNWFNSHF